MRQSEGFWFPATPAINVLCVRRRAEDLLKWLNGWEITNSLLGTKSITDIQSIIFSLLQVSSEHGGGGWPCCNTLLIHFNDSIIEQSVIILFWEFSRIVRDCLPINIYTICWKPLLSSFNVFWFKWEFSLIFGLLISIWLTYVQLWIKSKMA